jgi:hypothetical protein
MIVEAEVKVLLAVVGLVGIAVGAMTLLNASSAGFPDGYISPYDRSTAVWVTCLAYGLLLAGIFTLVAGLMSKPRRGVVGAVVVVLAWGGLFVLENCWNLGWCPPLYEQLAGTMFDDGQGG